MCIMKRGEGGADKEEKKEREKKCEPFPDTRILSSQISLGQQRSAESSPLGSLSLEFLQEWTLSGLSDFPTLRAIWECFFHGTIQSAHSSMDVS